LDSAFLKFGFQKFSQSFPPSTGIDFFLLFLISRKCRGSEFDNGLHPCSFYHNNDFFEDSNRGLPKGGCNSTQKKKAAHPKASGFF